jgi:hypothetical protein
VGFVRRQIEVIDAVETEGIHDIDDHRVLPLDQAAVSLIDDVMDLLKIKIIK